MDSLEGVWIEELALHLLVLVVEVVHGVAVSVEGVGLLVVGLVLLEAVRASLPDLVVGEGSLLGNAENVVVVLLGNSLEEVNFANFEKQLQSDQGIGPSLMTNALPRDTHFLGES